jgi:hypothetical protein
LNVLHDPDVPTQFVTQPSSYGQQSFQLSLLAFKAFKRSELKITKVTTQINCKASITTVIKREYGHKIGLIKLKFTMNKKHCLSLYGENLVLT